MLEAGFIFLVGPPQMMQFDRVELGSQQSQTLVLFQFLMNLLPMRLKKSRITRRNGWVSKPVFFCKVDNTAERYRVGETIGSTNCQRFIGIMWYCVKEMVGTSVQRSAKWFISAYDSKPQAVTPSQPTAPVNTTQEGKRFSRCKVIEISTSKI